MDQTTQAQQDAIDFIENTMMPFCSKYQMTDSSGRSFYASSMYNVFGQGVDYFKLIQFEREVMNFHEERNQSNVNEIGRDLFQEILVESPTVFLFALLDTANDNPTFAHRFILIAWPQSPKSMLIHSFEHPEHSELNFTPRATLVEHANWIQTLKIFVEGDMFDTNRKQDYCTLFGVDFGNHFSNLPYKASLMVFKTDLVDLPRLKSNFESHMLMAKK